MKLETVTYATRDEYPCNPRESYEAGTMVRVRDGYNGIDIDQPDSDIAEAWDLADQLRYVGPGEVYYAVICGCWGNHDLEVVEDECPSATEVLIAGEDDQHFQDGSSFGIEFVLDNFGPHAEGVDAMLTAWQEGNAWTTTFDLVKAYVEAGRPDITAFVEWSFTGYSQDDWAEGYIYTTIEDFGDPEAAMKAEVAEYAAWANGDVYLLVQETYIDNDQTDYDMIGGFYGEDAIEAAIKDGGHF